MLTMRVMHELFSHLYLYGMKGPVTLRHLMFYSTPFKGLFMGIGALRGTEPVRAESLYKVAAAGLTLTHGSAGETIGGLIRLAI